MSIVSRIVAGLALVLLLPLLLAISLAILFETGRPLLFRQARIGKSGRPFSIVKFRSMLVGDGGLKITGAADRRITRVGLFLRKYKLDELGQLWNIAAGHMSFIGPRPEVPEYVDLEDPRWRTVLARRPGITDLATLVFRNEEHLLGTADNPDRFYRECILPAKLQLNIQYGTTRTLKSDLRLLLLTLRYSFFPSTFDAESVKRSLRVETSH